MRRRYAHHGQSECDGGQRKLGPKEIGMSDANHNLLFRVKQRAVDEEADSLVAV